MAAETTERRGQSAGLYNIIDTNEPWKGRMLFTGKEKVNVILPVKLKLIRLQASNLLLILLSVLSLVYLFSFERFLIY